PRSGTCAAGRALRVVVPFRSEAGLGVGQQWIDSSCNCRRAQPTTASLIFTASRLRGSSSATATPAAADSGLYRRLTRDDEKRGACRAGAFRGPCADRDVGTRAPREGFTACPRKAAA